MLKQLKGKQTKKQENTWTNKNKKNKTPQNIQADLFVKERQSERQTFQSSHSSLFRREKQ